jgi:hypothetical protein
MRLPNDQPAHGTSISNFNGQEAEWRCTCCQRDRVAHVVRAAGVQRGEPWKLKRLRSTCSDAKEWSSPMGLQIVCTGQRVKQCVIRSPALVVARGNRLPLEPRGLLLYSRWAASRVVTILHDAFEVRTGSRILNLLEAKTENHVAAASRTRDLNLTSQNHP